MYPKFRFMNNNNNNNNNNNTNNYLNIINILEDILLIFMILVIVFGSGYLLHDVVNRYIFPNVEEEDNLN
jgi:hypothetical protein